MVAALDDAKGSMAEARSDDHYHGKLMTIVTGCNDVLLSIQGLSQEHDKLSQEGGYGMERMDIRTEELAALKADLGARIGALKLLNDGRTKVTLDRIEDALQQLIAQTRIKNREGSVISVQMHRSEDQNRLGAMDKRTENTPGQTSNDEHNPAAREGSVFSSTDSLTEDEQRNWRQVRKELQGVGITPALFAQRQGFITSRIRELIEEGAPEEEGTILAQSENGVLSPVKSTKVKPIKAYRLLNALGYRRHDKLLLAAIEAGNIAQVESCIKRGAKISVKENDRDSLKANMTLLTRNTSIMRLLSENNVKLEVERQDGGSGFLRVYPSLLCLAVYFAYKDIVQVLLAHGADTEVKDEHQGTPLVLAVDRGHKGIVQLLLEHGADTEVRDEHQWTPLILAAYEGHKDIVQLLLERGADIEATDGAEQTSLHLAALEGRRDTVQLLLEHGADIEATNTHGNTSLILAAARGHKDIVQLLVKHGADTKATVEQGNTSLHLAADRGHRDIVQLLLKHGADIKATNKHGNTSLLHAAGRGHTDIVQLLLEHGADIEATDTHGNTSLLHAAGRGHSDIVQLLLEHSADIGATNMYEMTSLVRAAGRGHKDIVQLLVKHGADIEATFTQGNTSLILAADRGHKDIVQLLLEHGADIEARAKDGRTPLIAAALGPLRKVDVVKVLLAHGANIKAKDKNGRDAIDHARTRGKSDVEQLLLAHRDSSQRQELISR
ncbi:MAG: hypothetical protein M1836_004631 [Candelina mexicana]|nr:MAG: hypothetical protein M1836_004631 [Candelina mexicana]